jgi:hypothetical protein
LDGRDSKASEHEDVMLRVHPDVAKELKSNNRRPPAERARRVRQRTIIVESDPARGSSLTSTDPSWVAVFCPAGGQIFVRRFPQNQQLI